MSASLQRAMSSLEEKELGLQQALQDTRVAESHLAQVSFLVHGHGHGHGHEHGHVIWLVHGHEHGHGHGHVICMARTWI